MADTTAGHTAALGRDGWQDDNDRGLALAGEGDWSEAIEAFAAAADSLARTLPAGSHEPLALVLGNMAQACFRVGRIEDAVQHQQRSSALRVALTGEDGMPVARARMDLAVMLASAGRCDDAWALIQRVIASVEHRVGEEDPRLAIVLENAARIALAANHAANAEPLLLRLHALLDAHEMSTARADHLLAQVAAVRALQADATAGIDARSIATPMVSSARLTATEATAETLAAEDANDASMPMGFGDTDSAVQVYAHASIAEQEEWEDQPLRDAVAVTDVLLRTTPSGVPIIPPAPVVEPPVLEADEHAADAMLDLVPLDDSDSDAFDAFDAHDAPQMEGGANDALLPATDGLDFALDLAFPDEPALVEEPDVEEPDVVVPQNHVSTAEAAGLTGPTHVSPTRTPPGDSFGGLSLGFDVEHGVLDGDTPTLQGPPISSPVPDALDAGAPTPVLPELQPPRVAPVTEIITSGPTTGIRPLEGLVATTPPLGAPAIEPPAPAPAPAPVRPARATGEQRQVPAKKSGASPLLYIIGGAVVIGGGAAAFFLLR